MPDYGTFARLCNRNAANPNSEKGFDHGLLGWAWISFLTDGCLIRAHLRSNTLGLLSFELVQGVEERGDMSERVGAAFFV